MLPAAPGTCWQHWKAGLAAVRSTASTGQVLEGLEQHKFSHLMAQLAVWLQQRPEVITEQAACSSSDSSSSSGDVSSSSNQGTCHVTTLWSACMSSLDEMAGVLADYTRTQKRSAVLHAAHLATALESTGANHDLRCNLNACVQHSSSNTILPFCFVRSMW
jgi:hypothetical protein